MRLLLLLAAAGVTAVLPLPPVTSSSHSGSSRSGRSVVPGGTKHINWSGHSWAVKDSQGGKAGPGPNVFSPSNVAIDAATDKLHLSISPVNGSTGEWSSAEILLSSGLGFGRYRWIMETPLSAMGGDGGFAKRPVLGMFLYKDDSHELDIEMSRWNDGYGANKTADYAVQPFSPRVETALHWTEPITAAPTYHQLIWSPDCVAFESGLIGRSISRNSWISD